MEVLIAAGAFALMMAVIKLEDLITDRIIFAIKRKKTGK